MKEEMIGWQWHQLDQTSLQTDNKASTSSLNFLQAGCPSWCPTTESRHWRQRKLQLLLHPFNSLFSRTTWVSQHHSGFYWSKRWWGGSDISWTICKSFEPRSRVQTDNHACTSPLGFYKPDALPAAQPTVSKYWRHKWSCKMCLYICSLSCKSKKMKIYWN